MNDIVPFLFSLLSQPGLSGSEEPVRTLIAEKWRPLVDEISISPLGSLHGLRKSVNEKKHPSLMIAAHMDAIGLMVKDISNGLLWVTKVGGVDPRVLPGQLVTIHGKKNLSGIVQLIPDRLMDKPDPAKAPQYEHLFIDTGLNEKELNHLVRIGDRVSFAQTPFKLDGNYAAGHSLDNRASVAALTVCLEEIKNYNLEWNLHAVATTQEELNMSGARTSAFDLQPDLAIAVDVTFAKGPASNDFHTFALDGGPTIGVGSNNHPGLQKKIASLAKELDMPYSLEAMPTSSGTDGMALQITANGIPVEVLGIPLRYMHTSVEMVSVKDVYRTGRLLARFITSLDANSMYSLFEEEKP